MANSSDRDSGTVSDNPDALGTGIASRLFRSSKSPKLERKSPTASVITVPSSRPIPRDSLLINAPDSQSRYFMGHENRGIALIINNKTFHRNLNLSDRHGSDVDADALEETFLSLGFTRANIYRYDDVTGHNMEKLMDHYAATDYQDMDCFVCAILSHGEDGAVYGYDRKTSLELLFQPFKTKMHPTLVGKPKIFLVQACRGDKVDDGRERLERDSPHIQRIPLEADFLYAYSTVPGYYSWRNAGKGSWFVQAISNNVKKHRRTPEMDFLRLLTRVNYEVAYEFQSNSPDKVNMHLKKQMPSVVSMLTKDLFFHQ